MSERCEKPRGMDFRLHSCLDILIECIFQGQGRAVTENVRLAKLDYGTLQEEANEELPVGLAGLEDAKAVRHVSPYGFML